LGIEVLFYQDDISQWEITSETVNITDDSLKLEGESSVDLVDRTFPRTPSSTVTFYLRHHSEEHSPMDMVQHSSIKCHCAVKLRMGTTELEIGEEWVRLQKLNADLTVNTTVEDASFHLNATGTHFLVTIEIDIDTMKLTIDGEELFTTMVEDVNLHDLSIASYMGAFTVTSFLIESEYSRYTMVVDEAEGYVDIPATFRSDQFNRGLGLKNHHYITWSGGRAGESALFTSSIADSLVHRALEQIGAVPGENLSLDSWEKRRDLSSPEPDIYATGTPLDIKIFSDGEWLTTETLLHDHQDKEFAFVFAGNMEYIPNWQSGCITCLQSCPGSKISHSGYTMRDLAQKRVEFSVNSGVLEPQKQVWIRFQAIQ